MKKLFKTIFFSVVIAIILLIGYSFFEHYLLNPPGIVDDYNDRRMAFENDIGEDIFITVYFTNELLEQAKNHPKDSRYPKKFLPYLAKREKFYFSKVDDEKKYFLENYWNRENLFSILIPKDITLFFGGPYLPESCSFELYSHFEFSVIKEGQNIKSTSIDFRKWCKMKDAGCYRNTEFKCALKASEVFKD